MSNGVIEMSSSGLHWKAIIDEDIRFLRSLLLDSHPGYYDDTDDTVRRILTDDWVQIDSLVDQVDSFDGVTAALQLATAQFCDPHLGISHLWSKNSIEWTGLIPVLQKGKVLVALDNLSTDNGLENFEIIKIDGLPALNWIESNTLKFMSTAPSGLRLNRAVTNCLYDFGNPFIRRPTTVTVSKQSFTKDIRLEWISASAAYCERTARNVLGSPQKKQGLERRGNDIFWIYVPTFDDSTTSLMDLIRESSTSIGSAKAVVIDLRGNGGGNSARSMEFLLLLFGPRVISFEKNSKTHWRASGGNANYIESLGSAFRNDSPDKKYLSKIAKHLRDSERNGCPFYEENDVSYDYSITGGTDAILKGVPIFVLIDGYCSSACLNFLDELVYQSAAGNIKECITLMGSSTSADGPYNDIRIERLPSGIGDIYFPMKRISYAGRKPYSGYDPDLMYSGFSRADEAIETWALAEITRILEL